MQPNRKPQTLAFSALCSGLLLGFFLAGTVGKAQTSSQTVYGTIADESGTPIAGATIRVKSLVGSPITLKSKTNKKGKYRLVLPPFKWEFDLSLEKEGYHPYFETVDFQMLRNGERSIVEDFTLLTLEGAARRALQQARDGEIMHGIQGEAVTAFNQGARYYNSGDLEEARASLEEAIAADPAIAPARRLLALTHFRLESYPEAATAAQAIIELTADDREMWEILRDAAQKSGDEEALERAQAGLAALP